MNCPMCSGPVEVVGRTTLHYERRDLFEEALEQEERSLGRPITYVAGWQYGSDPTVTVVIYDAEPTTIIGFTQSARRFVVSVDGKGSTSGIVSIRSERDGS